MRDSTSDTTFHMARHIHWRLWIIRLLSLAGMGVSAYLAWTHLAHQSVACGQSQDCDVVQQSVYSEVAGIPVALFGLIAYTVLFVLTLLRGRVPDPWDYYVPLAIFGISLIGMLYSAYLTYLELFVIHAICQWCVSSAIIITAIFIISLPELKTEVDPS